MVVLTEDQILKKTKGVFDLDHITTLNLWGQELTDITVLGHLTRLEVLSLSVNRITNIEPLSRLYNLKELYLRKNLITASQLGHFASLRNLQNLSLSENPCTENNYRLDILQICPSLVRLDDEIVTDAERRQAVSSAVPGHNQKKHKIEPGPKYIWAGNGISPSTPPNRSIASPPIQPPAALDCLSSRQRQNNILVAVISLVGELDPKSLRVVKKEVDSLVNSNRSP